METKTKKILSVMHVVCWVLFVGVCLKTGALVFSFVISLTGSTSAAHNLYRGLDLSALYANQLPHYVTLVCLVIAIWGLQAFLVYLVLRIFAKINFMHPFSADIAELVSRISYVALIIGFSTLMVYHYSDWINAKLTHLPNLQAYLTGGAEFVLLGMIIFVIAQVFKRGIEIQTENELTV